MTAEALGDAEVDVCTPCGGMWVDWFDGEVRAISAEVLATETGRGSRPSAPASSLRNESLATGACPRCTRQLVAERFMIHEQGASPAGPAREAIAIATDAVVLRCEDCLGVFVPRASAALLATLRTYDAAPPSSTEGAAILEPLPWQRFMALVKRLLGLSE
jgi:hypothetical protein